MAQQAQDSSIIDAVERLKDPGFGALAEAVTVLMNTAMVAERSEYLGARPYERIEERRGYANGFKTKTVKTRLGELSLRVPQTRDNKFYPQSLLVSAVLMEIRFMCCLHKTRAGVVLAKADQSAVCNGQRSVVHDGLIIGVGDHGQKRAGIGVARDKGDIPVFIRRPGQHAFLMAAPEDLAAEPAKDRRRVFAVAPVRLGAGAGLAAGVDRGFFEADQIQHQYRRIARQRFEGIELLARGVDMVHARSLLRMAAQRWSG